MKTIKDSSQNISNQTTTQQLQPIQQLEVKPKFEFGTIYMATIFGIILTAITTYIVKIFWDRRQRYRKASDALYTAFTPALAQIYLAKKHSRFDVSTAPNIEKFLSDSLSEQATVIEKFRIFVPKSKSAEYQKAWEEYRSEVAFGFDTTRYRPDIDDPYAMYENLIHTILTFANTK